MTIYIGNKVIINMNCTFVDNHRIDIGDNVLIASNVQIYTATHSTVFSERMVEDAENAGDEICYTIASPVRIEEGAWIGGGVIILPGVSIGRNSVVGSRKRGDAFHSCQLRGGGQSLPGASESVNR